MDRAIKPYEQAKAMLGNANLIARVCLKVQKRAVALIWAYRMKILKYMQLNIRNRLCF